MKQQISLREANQHLARYVEAVEKGDEVVITRHGSPVAKLLGIPKKRQLSLEQKVVWQKFHAQMQKGYNWGGKKFDRESAHGR